MFIFLTCHYHLFVIKRKSNACPKNDRGIVKALKEYRWEIVLKHVYLLVDYFGLTVFEPRIIEECVMSV